MPAQAGPAIQVDPLGAYRFALLWGAAATATYQLYFLPALGTFFPLALILAYAGMPTLRVRLADRDIGRLFLAYAAVTVVSGLWSPDFGAWANGMAYGFLFYCAFFLSRSFADSAPVERILNAFLLFASLNAVMVIVFRLSPGIEDVFFASSLRNVFSNPKLVANYELFVPNTYDPDKAGGVFGNANTGSAFSLMCVGITIATMGTRKHLANGILFVLFSLATVMSGSKSAVMIYAAAISILGFLVFLRVPSAHLRLILLSVTGTVATLATIVAIVFFDSIGSSEFSQNVSQTSEYRMLLWRVARLTFPDHPIRGLGFGGWYDVLANYAATGVNIAWPPHNSLVMAWAESGIFAPILLVWIFWRILSRLIRHAAQDEERRPALGALFALGCVSGMSMGDTFPLFGNQNMAVPLGILIAYAVTDRKPRTVPAPGDDRHAGTKETA